MPEIHDASVEPDVTDTLAKLPRRIWLRALGITAFACGVGTPLAYIRTGESGLVVGLMTIALLCAGVAMCIEKKASKGANRP